MVSDFNKPLDELMQEKGFKVRLAFAKALDRERYIEQAQFGRGTPAYGSVNPAQSFFFDPTRDRATSASTSRRPSACSPRPATRMARAFPCSRSCTLRTSAARSR